MKHNIQQIVQNELSACDLSSISVAPEKAQMTDRQSYFQQQSMELLNERGLLHQQVQTLNKQLTTQKVQNQVLDTKMKQTQEQLDLSQKQSIAMRKLLEQLRDKYLSLEKEHKSMHTSYSAFQKEKVLAELAQAQLQGQNSELNKQICTLLIEKEEQMSEIALLVQKVQGHQYELSLKDQQIDEAAQILRMKNQELFILEEKVNTLQIEQNTESKDLQLQLLQLRVKQLEQQLIEQTVTKSYKDVKNVEMSAKITENELKQEEPEINKEETKTAEIPKKRIILKKTELDVKDLTPQ
ncbi:Hypothetical_protein [Hexamita inflata]|uniref:Hypothetical_protein n=1 Tax=Hexamita inflata TaxID=28002 RepID=A0AA86QM35_9EUKA|nr:Hypothetical protein HINF_LOCUS46001 [Hexamita inflata]